MAERLVSVAILHSFRGVYFIRKSWVLVLRQIFSSLSLARKGMHIKHLTAIDWKEKKRRDAKSNKSKESGSRKKNVAKFVKRKTRKMEWKKGGVSCGNNSCGTRALKTRIHHWISSLSFARTRTTDTHTVCRQTEGKKTYPLCVKKTFLRTGGDLLSNIEQCGAR